MANLNEQTENTFYGFTPKGLEQETQKFILDPKEEKKMQLKPQKVLELEL